VPHRTSARANFCWGAAGQGSTSCSCPETQPAPGGQQAPGLCLLPVTVLGPRLPVSITGIFFRSGWMEEKPEVSAKLPTANSSWVLVRGSF